MTKLKGIDVSHNQGVIDWDKVKADGVQFAIIRLGYGSDIKSQDDKQFERNVKEAERVGIPWGTYLYSYALNVDQAKSEAEHALRLLKGKKPSYPIAFDMEDADKYKEKHGMPSDDVLVDICDTFLSILKDAGYDVRLYANLDWLMSKLKSSKLDKYTKWVAQWGPKCSYHKEFDIWQYTNSGTVDGIEGRVDMNHSYSDFGVNKQPEKKPEAKKFKVNKTINGYINAADAKHRKNKKGTVKAGTYYVFNQSQGMINVTSKNGVPGSWINPADNNHTATVSNKKYHKVVSGDTVSELAVKYGSTTSLIKSWNHLKDVNKIYAGQKLRVK